MVNENTEYGNSVSKVIKDQFAKDGLNMAQQIAYSANTTDVQPQVLQLKDKNPDVVIFISYTSDAILYSKTIQALDYKPAMMIADNAGFNDPSFVKTTGSLVDGLINRSAFAGRQAGPGISAILSTNSTRRRPATTSTTSRARGMQGLLVLADAINRAGSTEPAKIQAALKATDLKASQMIAGYNGVKFDDKGQNTLASSIITQMRGGAYVPVWPKDRAQTRRSCCRCRTEGWVPSHLPFGRGIRDVRMRAAPLSGRSSATAADRRGLLRTRHSLLQVIVSGLLLGAVYALFSSGLTLIWGMMNVVNFAHGEFVMLAMYVAFMIWTALGGGPAASVPLAAMVLATLGVACYFFLVRHIMKGPMLAQILGTFGLALFLRYAAFWYFRLRLPHAAGHAGRRAAGLGRPAHRRAAPARRRDRHCWSRSGSTSC